MNHQNQSSGEARLELIYKRLLTFVTALLVAYGLFYLGHYFYSIVALLGVALVMTYILIGPVILLEKGLVALGEPFRKEPFGKRPLLQEPNRLTRALSVIIVYVMFFTLMTLASVKLFPLIGSQVQEFSEELPGYMTQAEEKLTEWSNNTLSSTVFQTIFQETQIKDPKKNGNSKPSSQSFSKDLEEPAVLEPEAQAIIQDSFLKNATGQWVAIVERTIGSALNNVTTLITGTMNGLFYTIVGFLLVFYFLMDGHQLRQGFERLLPKSMRSSVHQLIDSFHQVMFAFIKGQVLLGILTGTYMFIIYSIFGVSFSFFLGAFFAISEILPVVGTWIGITPGIIVMLFTNPILIIPVWLCSYAFQTIKDNVIAPKIVGDVMGLHPVVVIFSLIICAKAAGLVGILLALPLASILNIMIHHYRKKYDDDFEPVSISDEKSVAGGV